MEEQLEANFMKHSRKEHPKKRWSQMHERL